MGKKDRGGKNSKRKRREQGFNSRGNSVGRKNYASGKILETMTAEKWAEIKAQKERQEQQPIKEEVSLFDSKAIYGLDELLVFHNRHHQEASYSEVVSNNNTFGRSISYKETPSKSVDSLLLVHDFKMDSKGYHKLAIENKWVVQDTTLTTKKKYDLPNGLTARMYTCKDLGLAIQVLEFEYQIIKPIHLNGATSFAYHTDKIKSTIKEHAKPLQEGEYVSKPIVVFGTRISREDTSKLAKRRREIGLYTPPIKEDTIHIAHHKTFPLYLLGLDNNPHNQQPVINCPDKVVSQFKIYLHQGMKVADDFGIKYINLKNEKELEYSLRGFVL